MGHGDGIVSAKAELPRIAPGAAGITWLQRNNGRNEANDERAGHSMMRRKARRRYGDRTH